MSEPRDPPAALQLRIEKPVYGGAGLARDEGKVIFVPYTLPGEVVAATVTHRKASFAEATLGSVLEPSLDRSTPPCPYFGVCGGCHYQHALYPAQLAIKAAILKETLARAQLTDLPDVVVHGGEPLGYRNRVRLHIDPITSALGYRERASDRLVAVELCPIAAPEIEQALALVSKACAEQQAGRTFSQLELSINDDASELLLALWLRAEARTGEARLRLAQLCGTLQPLLPALSGAGVHAPQQQAAAAAGRGRPQLAKRSRDTRAGESGGDEAPGALIATWGTPQMTYRVGGLAYQVSLGAFFQVNRGLISTLVELATSGRSGKLAWDLYAGVGLFSRVLASRFEQVVAVEGAAVSARDLRSQLALPHRAVESSTLAFLQDATAAGRRSAVGHRGGPRAAAPDFVLVDPPRAGLGEEVTRLLGQLRPADITYVSCDPATLSRDLRALVDSGYKLHQLHLIDLFPQTFHLEAVAMLSLA